jgi:osmotically-inducible protein OsmY
MILLKNLTIASILALSVGFGACHNKARESNTTTETTTATDTTSTTAPVQISPDDELNKGVRDATKDYPGVNATVSNGEITLSGEITRDKLPRLMQSLNSLHPKKINNNLTIK